MSDNLALRYFLRHLQFSLVVVLLLFLAGCNQGDSTKTPLTDGKTEAVSKTDGSEVENKNSLMDRASQLVNSAKNAGSDGAQWVSDTAGNVAQSGSEMVGDSAEWVNSTFNSLKDQGLTTASNATEWLTEDYNNMGAWQYKVLKVSPAEAEGIETKLDELGKAHWECFHVAEVGENQLFYFKKSRRSYIRSLPMRDVLKLIPLMGGGGDGN